MANPPDVSVKNDFDPRLEATPRTSGDGRPPSRDLSRARVAAQERIERARSVPKFMVLVEDYSGGSKGNLRARFGLGAYMGTVGSTIEYILTADGPDETNGGLIGIDELRVIPSAQNVVLAKEERRSSVVGSLKGGSGGNAKEDAKDRTEHRGCEGLWNKEHKKGRKWWGHVEREREGGLLGFEMLFV